VRGASKKKVVEIVNCKWSFVVDVDVDVVEMHGWKE